jgi:hypothetical protein
LVPEVVTAILDVVEMVAVATFEQPLLSVIVTVYEPADNEEMHDVVAPFDQL